MTLFASVYWPLLPQLDNTVHFSLNQFVRSEASAHRFSHSISSADNDVYGQTGLDLSQ